MNPKPFLLAATLSAAIAAPRAQAQPVPAMAPAPRPMGDNLAQWQLFRATHVSANLMASWLDPAHNTVAPQYKDVKPSWAAGKTPSEIRGMLARPEGVQAVIGLGPENTLWVLATPAGLRQTERKIALLDQPLLQVEVQARCVQISLADARALGIQLDKLPSQGPLQEPLPGSMPVEIGLAGPNIDAQITDLVIQKRARILTAPKVQALLGSTANLRSLSTAPVIVGLENKNGMQIRQLSPSGRGQNQDQYLLGIDTSIGLTVTPNLGADGTIELQLGPLRTVGITGYGPGGNSQPTAAKHITLRDLDGIPSRPIRLKEAQTAVLQGLTWNLPATGGMGFLDDSKEPPQNVLVLVTARLIRRAAKEVETVAMQR